MFRSGIVSINRALAKFRREEDGALVVFGLVLLTLMLMLLTFAVGLAEVEYNSTKLVNTLERGSLAATSWTNTMRPEAVVRDYMLKAGISNQLTNVQVVEELNSRTVRADGYIDGTQFFLPMLGIDHFDVPRQAEATQSIQNVEIVLVLDVSGSMAGQKLANLKIAATEFVDTVMGNDTYHRVSIGIVPYNAQVNIGTDLKTAFTLTHDAHVANVNCVEIPDSAYATQAISRVTPMAMMAYADIYNGTNYANAALAPTSGNAVPNYAATYCKQTTVNVVRLPSTDATVLKAQINALTAGGNTSITLGMKWGATLIDPSMRDAYAGFIGQGKMASTLTDRPFDYDDDHAMKVVVLMTDGDHVAHTRVTDDYKTGPSGIYKGTDGNYSVRFTAGRPAVAGANEYWVPHLGQWKPTPWSTGVEQDWAQIWASLRMSYVAWQFYGRALGTDDTSRANVYYAKIAAMQSYYAGPDKDTAEDNMDASLQTTCDQVKDNGALIYGITVEAPPHGNEVITNCAGTDRTFIADRSTIRSVFQSIASDLSALRLTQ